MSCQNGARAGPAPNPPLHGARQVGQPPWTQCPPGRPWCSGRPVGPAARLGLPLHARMRPPKFAQTPACRNADGLTPAGRALLGLLRAQAPVRQVYVDAPHEKAPTSVVQVCLRCHDPRKPKGPDALAPRRPPPSSRTTSHWRQSKRSSCAEPMHSALPEQLVARIWLRIRVASCSAPAPASRGCAAPPACPTRGLG